MYTSLSDADILWQDVLSVAKDSYIDMLPWLERLQPQSFDNNHLIMSTKQKWTERKVMSEYKSKIESLLYDITLEHISFEVLLQNMPFNTSEPTIYTPKTINKPTYPEPQKQIIEPLQNISPARLAGLEKNNISYSQPSTPITFIDDVQVKPNKSVASQISSIESRMNTNRIDEFTFENFVVGEANRLAFKFTQDVAVQPGCTANPLFIYGSSGYGKTHLLYAICNYIKMNQHDAYKVIYVPADTFVEQYVENVHNRNIHGEQVTKEYKEADILLVDDVQQFAGKQESMSTFFNIFNDLIRQGKQIVLAADVAPDYLNFDARMKTRFGQGLVVDIKTPTYEMKRSILKNLYMRSPLRADLKNNIPDEVFDYIAELGPDNPRSMQGIITSLIPEATQNPAIFTYSGIQDFINKLHRASDSINITMIAKKICEHYAIDVATIQGKSRVKNVSEARQVVMWMSRQLTDLTYDEIGEFLGGRDHATVSYGINVVDKRCADKGYSYMLTQLKRSITDE